MLRRWIFTLPWLTSLALLSSATPGNAGLFDGGIGSAMYYGPYTGGHIYSYNYAYGYGLSPDFTDSWRVDPLAYPAGIHPYKPVLNRLWGHGDDRAPGVIVDDPVPGPLPAPLPTLKPVTATTQAAVIKVTVPPGAEVWIEGKRTTQVGTERVFQSPPLETGKGYLYSVRARWTDATGSVEQFQAVNVMAGGTATVRFPAPRP